MPVSDIRETKCLLVTMKCVYYQEQDMSPQVVTVITFRIVPLETSPRALIKGGDIQAYVLCIGGASLSGNTGLPGNTGDTFLFCISKH